MEGRPKRKRRSTPPPPRPRSPPPGPPPKVEFEVDWVASGKVGREIINQGRSQICGPICAAGTTASNFMIFGGQEGTVQLSIQHLVNVIDTKKSKIQKSFRYIKDNGVGKDEEWKWNGRFRRDSTKLTSLTEVMRCKSYFVRIVRDVYGSYISLRKIAEMVRKRPIIGGIYNTPGFTFLRPDSVYEVESHLCYFTDSTFYGAAVAATVDVDLGDDDDDDDDDDDSQHSAMTTPDRILDLPSFAELPDINHEALTWDSQHYTSLFHFVQLVGTGMYNGRRVYKVKNSYGQKWCDGSYGFVDERSIIAIAYPRDTYWEKRDTE